MSNLHVMSLRRAAILVLLALACSCATTKRDASEPVGVSTVRSAGITADPLASWSAGPAKQAILDLVARASAAGSASFVPEEERVATFDTDGTLWPEKPLPEAAFTIARLESEVANNRALENQEPFKSILKSDTEGLSSLDRHVVLSAIARTHSGMTDEAFETKVHTFLVDARHPVLGVPYAALVYRPMRELLAHLRDHNFTIYVCTAGDQGFVRAYAPAMYGIPRERIIGSTFAKELVRENGRTVLRRKPDLASYNDKEEKVVNIERHIGRRPLLAAGNVGSGGDIAMLTYARERVGASLALVVNHDDPVRELAYREPDGATLAAARKHGFIVVSMRADWTQVFDAPPVQRAAEPVGRGGSAR